jgi:GNAT superfamily N-acetyltransferase
MPPAPFVVFSLPRCRTAWLSRFLTYGDWHCGHEQGRFCRTPADIKAWLETPYFGTVETAAGGFWRTLRAMNPATRVVVLRRPVDEVVESLLRQCPFDRGSLEALIRKADRKLAQIARRWPNALSVTYAELADEAVCARVFEHCLPGYRHDPAWWRALEGVNIQINLPAMMRYHVANQAGIEKLAAILRQTSLDLLERRAPVDNDALTLSVEPFDKFYADAQKAFASHLAATDQVPDPAFKNIELLRRMDDIGALQCVTARSNGRIFGYLMTVIGPSIDGADILSGIHVPFYADPSFPGLGMLLQRFARDELRKRGCTEIFMRAGVRGSGPRLGALYRRLGAEELGQLYRINLT